MSVRFTNPAIQFDYRAEQSTARRFGAAMAPTGAEVTIEFDPGESCIAALPPLPCARLWA
ncbi:hypothetical protein AB0L57_30400 [Nocardia sp. NPDC052254]|uniref:hypothetical protein n=1 Tax=Nocardia sp. NPDC052254 TaxID=3155681 RepID=UPI00343389D3